MNKPKKLNNWFYMVLKELRRYGYVDMLENWDIEYDEALEIHKYIEEKLDIKLP